MLLAFFFLTQHAAAQTIGTCAPAEAEAYLDAGNVRARIFNNGSLFWSGGHPVYEVPKGSGHHVIFNTTIWLGGKVGGELRAAAGRYQQRQYWPGPLDDHGNPPADCRPFDRIYEITRDDLVAYAETGEPTDNLRDWPWTLGAPVLDGDSIDGNYDLKAGDRPALMGDQMLWWVMNDAGNEHVRPGADTPPIGMEVHASAFAFNRPTSYIGNITFYRYVLHYKGPTPFEDAYFGLFADPDLGHFADDYIGSDSTLGLGFVYNGDNFDEPDWGGYAEAPPALGYTFLRSPTATDNARDDDHDGTIDEPGEMRGMTAFMTGDGDGGVVGDPQRAEDFYNYMQARWKDGRPLTLGGYGREFSDIPVNFYFPGDPLTGAFWSEFNTDAQGTARRPGNRFFQMATGPTSMQPGGTQEILFAIVWARGADNLDSVRQLKTDVKRLREVAERILAPDVTSGVPEPAPEPTPVLGLAHNYPNPFRETTTIRYSLPQPMYVRLRIYDLLGRHHATLVEALQAPGLYEVPFAAEGLPDGVYLYRIELDHLSTTRRMVLMR